MEKHNEIRFKLSFDEMFMPIVSTALLDLGFDSKKHILQVEQNASGSNTLIRKSTSRDGTFIILIPTKEPDGPWGKGYLGTGKTHTVLELKYYQIFSEEFMSKMTEAGYTPGVICVFKNNYDTSEVLIEWSKEKRKLIISIPEKEE